MLCFIRSEFPPPRNFFHITCPVFRFTHHSSIRSRSVTLTKILSPQTIGVDPLRPGSASFHWTFSVFPHRNGTFVSSLTPLCSGPRQCGQFSADEAITAVHRRSMKANSVRMNKSSLIFIQCDVTNQL